MLKILENRDEVIDLIHQLSEQLELGSFRVGVAGSYVSGLNKKNSSIDIVLKLKDGKDKNFIGRVEFIDFIASYMREIYSNKFQVIWLDLLESDEETLLNYMRTTGLEVNPESAYTNIVEDVRWADEDNDSDEDDTVKSSVMTWDENEEDDEDADVDTETDSDNEDKEGEE